MALASSETGDGEGAELSSGPRGLLSESSYRQLCVLDAPGEEWEFC